MTQTAEPRHGDDLRVVDGWLRSLPASRSPGVIERVRRPQFHLGTRVMRRDLRPPFIGFVVYGKGSRIVLTFDQW